MEALLIHPSPVGETVYSIAARYRVANRTGHSGPGDLFGAHRRSAASLLPTGLSALLARFPERLRPEPEAFVRDHTALPFFQPFIDEERANRSITAAYSGGNLHMLLGTAPNGILEARQLRLCPKCVENDLSTYGFPYWHREHQFSFVLTCWRHKEPLRETDIANRSLPCSCPFVTVPKTETTRPIHLPADPAQILPRLARDVASLLRDPIHSVGPLKIHAQLYHRLHKNSYVNTNGSVKITELCRNMRVKFGPQILESLGYPYVEPVHGSWVADTVRRPRCTHAPIKFLLLGYFFDVGARRLLSEAAKMVPRPPRSSAKPHPHRIRSRERLTALREQKRQLWKQVKGSQHTRQKANVYAWLWRNDRNWLIQHRGQRARHTMPRRNWAEQDTRIAQDIQVIAASTRCCWPPIRASRHRIASSIKYANYLLHRSNRLPKSVAALAKCTESAEDFSCRRLKLHARRNPALCEGKPWRLIRAAGIGAGQSNKTAVRRILNSLQVR